MHSLAYNEVRCDLKLLSIDSSHHHIEEVGNEILFKNRIAYRILVLNGQIIEGNFSYTQILNLFLKNLCVLSMKKHTSSFPLLTR